MHYPKVLVGGPVSRHHEYSTDAFIRALKEMDYPNFDILLIDNSDNEEFYNKFRDKVSMIKADFQTDDIKRKMVCSRNLIREKVLEGNYDYFFNVDQDTVVPKDALKKLVSDNKNVVSGVYYNLFPTYSGGKIELPIAYGWYSEGHQADILKNKEIIKEKNPAFYNALTKANWDFQRIRRPLTKEEVEEPKSMEIKMCGTGCILIHRNVLEKLEFRENLEGGFDDVTFCNDVIEKLGLKIYLDTSVKCGHLVKERPWRWMTDGKKHIIR